MGVTYKDYYKILGVSRSDSADELKKAFRDLAKKHHPDKNKGNKQAEDKFKEISEAYEVLGDPKRKQQYDMLGSNFRDGQSFTPPPEWGQFNGGQGGQGGTFHFRSGGGGADFGDLFDMLRGFGGSGGGGGGMFENIFEQAGARGGQAGFGGGGSPHMGPSHLESEMTLSLEDAYKGGPKKVSIVVPEPGPHGHVRSTPKMYDIKVPPGIQDGQKIRLKGEGTGVGDLLIRVKIAPHQLFSFEGQDLVSELKVAPWEAALGAKLNVPTLDGKVEMKLPQGVRSGQKLRLQGKGYPVKGGGRGDLYLRVMIHVPKELSEQERDLYERLRVISKFNPRGE